MTTSISRITTAHVKALGRQSICACRTPDEVDGVAHDVCAAYGLVEEMPADCTWADCARVLVSSMGGESDEICLPHPLTPAACSSLRALADFLRSAQVRRDQREAADDCIVHVDPSGMPTRCQVCTVNHPFEREIFPFCTYRCAARETLEAFRKLARCYACGRVAARFVRTLDSGETDRRPFCPTCALGFSDASIEACRASTVHALRADARDVRQSAAAIAEG